ncbi:MAG: hypothetical protein JOZ29_01470 [Deltaproteobacteria bacterium]|nr:hypothetical protein [Deltaproteobacteria bacterium]
MKLLLTVVRRKFIKSQGSTNGKLRTLVFQKTLQSLLTWIASATRSAAMLFLVLAGFWFDAQTASAQTVNNNIATVDGSAYSLTAAGVQTAINNVGSIAASTGVAGAVMLPATAIQLGSTGLIMRSQVSLIGISSEASQLVYNGTGNAILFPTGTNFSGLKHLSVALGSSAGANATGIAIRGNFNGGLVATFDKIQDVSVFAPFLQQGQIGIYVADQNGVPSGVQHSWFNTIMIYNLGQPIQVNGQEGNFWSDIVIYGFSSLAVNDSNANDNYWQGIRIAGITSSSSAIGFQEGGVLNQIHLTCDLGIGGQTCINDTPWGKNIWDISALTPIGATSSLSFYREIGAAYGSIPANFQVSSLAVTNTSSTVRLGGGTNPGCLEIGSRNGNRDTSYITFLDGTMSIDTTRPAACQ